MLLIRKNHFISIDLTEKNKGKEYINEFQRHSLFTRRYYKLRWLVDHLRRYAKKELI